MFHRYSQTAISHERLEVGMIPHIMHMIHHVYVECSMHVIIIITCGRSDLVVTGHFYFYLLKVKALFSQLLSYMHVT